MPENQEAAVSTAGARERSRLSVWVLALSPLALVALVFGSWALPKAPDGSLMLLAGEWKGTDAAGHADEWAQPGVDDSTWKPVHLPGSFRRQGLVSDELVLRRSFELPEAMRDAELALVVGYIRQGVLQVVINGQLVGSKGVYENRFVGARSPSAVIWVPRRVLQPGTNLIALKVHPLDETIEGISDPRLLFGRYDVVWPWASNEASVRNLIESGSLLLMLMLGALVAAIWRTQKGTAQVDLYRATVIMLGAVMMYLISTVGLLLPAVMSANAIGIVTVLSIYGIGLSVPEFAESYFLNRTTVARKVNRLVSVGFFIADLVSLAVTGHNVHGYRLYVVWLFIIIVYALVISARSVLQRTRRLAPIAMMAVSFAIAGGINDLLCDLNLIFTPRLFTMSVSTLAVTAALVVLGEFFKLAEDNARLTGTLGVRNAELAEALVKSEEGARVKTEFLAKTSHELRTPLNSIINIPIGLLEGLREVRTARCPTCQHGQLLDEGATFDAASPCPSCGKTGRSLETNYENEIEGRDTARLLKSVVRSGEHLLAVVNDILDYSKIDAGRVTLYPEPLEVKALLEDLGTTMGVVAEKAKVTLRIEPGEAGLSVEADRVKLQQVLINLVGNAIKFSDGKGTVTVRASAGAGGRGVVIKVIDQGIGIAPDQQAVIFEGFRQVESGSTRRFGGTGLGLAISRRLVELHGGHLKVESALGQGSTFIVELPNVPIKAAEPTAPKAGRTIVLVVDDDASALDTTAMALRPLDLTVVGLRDSREVLAKLRRERPRLIVLDVMMPHVSGLEVLKNVRADPDLKNLPVLVASAYPGSREVARSFGAEFIEKPWSPGALLALAKKLMGEHQA